MEDAGAVSALSVSAHPIVDMSEKTSGTPGRKAAILGFLYAVCMIEGADMQLLPASFRALEVNLGLTPSSLALLALGQALATCICAPIWGSLADHGFSRKRLLACGALAWGFITMLLSMVSSFPLMFSLRVLSGMALGSLSPISQSLLVEVSAPGERGKYFGGVQFIANFGSIICAIGTSTISMQLVLGSIQGWRVAFATVANMSILLAFAICMYMPEPTVSSTSTMPSISGELSKLMRYLRIPTFRVIVLQGIFGCIPWGALSFTMFYFQYVGISDFRASVLFGLSMAGGAVGGLLGGMVGDYLARWSPKHGRPLTAQISVAAGIPLIGSILAVVPRDPGYFPTYCVLMFAFGVMASWCAAGVNRPILAEIVDERDRASVFAWLVTIDGSFAALFGAPMVGFLAESVFGYHPSTLLVSQMPIEQRQTNAAALGHALLWCCIVPWLLCLICFSFLHVTYAQDINMADKEDNKALPVTSSLLSKGRSMI